MAWICCFADDGIDRRAEAEFFKSLGSGGPIKSALEGGDDEKFDKANKILLYRYLRILFPTAETKFSFPAEMHFSPEAFNFFLKLIWSKIIHLLKRVKLLNNIKLRNFLSFELSTGFKHQVMK